MWATSCYTVSFRVSFPVFYLLLDWIFLKNSVYFWAVLCLHCYMQAFSSWGEQGLLWLQCPGFSLWWLLLSWSIGSWVCGLQESWRRVSVVVAHGLCSTQAQVPWPDQRSNLCPLHWHVESQPLDHQRSLRLNIFYDFIFFLCWFVSYSSSLGYFSGGFRVYNFIYICL